MNTKTLFYDFFFKSKSSLLFPTIICENLYLHNVYHCSFRTCNKHSKQTLINFLSTHLRIKTSSFSCRRFYFFYIPLLSLLSLYNNSSSNAFLLNQETTTKNFFFFFLLRYALTALFFPPCEF